jgi:hypothetical protein
MHEKAIVRMQCVSSPECQRPSTRSLGMTRLLSESNVQFAQLADRGLLIRVLYDEDRKDNTYALAKALCAQL